MNPPSFTSFHTSPIAAAASSGGVKSPGGTGATSTVPVNRFQYEEMDLRQNWLAQKESRLQTEAERLSTIASSLQTDYQRLQVRPVPLPVACLL